MTYLSTDARIVDLHRDADKFATRVAQVFKREDRVEKYPYSDGAFRRIGADQLALHRAMFDLCSDGWVFTGPLILRTMHDLVISAVIIGEVEPEAEYRGFNTNSSPHSQFPRKQTSRPSLQGRHAANIHRH